MRRTAISELDPAALVEIADDDIAEDAIPAGLGYWLHRAWCRLRPVLVGAAFWLWRGWSHARPAVAGLGHQLGRAWGGLRPRLARAVHGLRRWRRTASARARPAAPLRPRARFLPAGLLGRGRLPLWLRGLWPGWPTTWGRLSAMAGGAFLLGCALVLPFALASRREPPPVALARVPGLLPGTAGDSVPRPVPALGVHAPELGVGPARPAAPAERIRRIRADTARQMALESFENGRALEGASYYRIARRAERRAAEDDVLILYTIAALSDPAAGAAAGRLLRDLGPEARPLLAATSRAHPDPLVKVRARALLKPPRRPFLRWVR